MTTAITTPAREPRAQKQPRNAQNGLDAVQRVFLAQPFARAYPRGRMNAPNPRCATLVVIEYGASWPKWLEPSNVGDVAVVAQHYEGEPGSLVTQVASRVTKLEVMGWQLDTLVLVANGRTDPAASAARSVLARGLLSRLKAATGQLVLTVDDRAGTRAAHSLTALAAALDGTGGVMLSVRIGDAEPILGRSPVPPVAQAC
jgi:hypothetical protein